MDIFRWISPILPLSILQTVDLPDFGSPSTNTFGLKGTSRGIVEPAVNFEGSLRNYYYSS